MSCQTLEREFPLSQLHSRRGFSAVHSCMMVGWWSDVRPKRDMRHVGEAIQPCIAKCESRAVKLSRPGYQTRVLCLLSCFDRIMYDRVLIRRCFIELFSCHVQHEVFLPVIDLHLRPCNTTADTAEAADFWTPVRLEEGGLFSKKQ